MVRLPQTRSPFYLSIIHSALFYAIHGGGHYIGAKTRGVPAGLPDAHQVKSDFECNTSCSAALCSSMNPCWLSINSSKPWNYANRPLSSLRHTQENLCKMADACLYPRYPNPQVRPLRLPITIVADSSDRCTRDSCTRAFCLHVGAVFATEFKHGAVISSIGRSQPSPAEYHHTRASTMESAASRPRKVRMFHSPMGDIGR